MRFGSLVPLALRAMLPALGSVAGWTSDGRGRSAAVTLQRMAGIVNQDVQNPAVFELAGSIVEGIDGKDFRAQARAMLRWLRVHTEFLRDPGGVELLRTPTYMIYQIEKTGHAQGDCDDIAMLAAALAKAVGLPVWFVAEAYEGGPLAPLVHVFAVVQTPEGYWAQDTQRPPSSPVVTPVRRISTEV